MIKLLQRTETYRGSIRHLYQQADIGRYQFDGYTFPFIPIATYNCWYCRYKQTFHNIDEFSTCEKKHQCDHSRLPIIAMSTPINDEVDGEWTNPDGTTLTYQQTGIYKQVTFEAQPNHVQLFLCNNGQAQCNASCWWHEWRLKNKRTWRQCGATHLCQNDGSQWVLMVPTDAALREEFLNQL